MHINFTDIVNSIVENGWGEDFSHIDEAAINLMEDNSKLTAYALIELLNRLNSIAKAAGANTDTSTFHGMTISEDHGRYPNKSVGDSLYVGNLEYGIKRLLIVAKDEHHHCIVVRCGDFDLEDSQPYFARRGCYESLDEAVIHEATNGRRQHTALASYMEAALVAVGNGGDLSAYFSEFVDPDEED